MWGRTATHVHCTGMAILSSVLLLLTLAALVTAYVAKVTLMESQISNNVQGQKQAFHAANSGLNKALATLRVKPDWVTSGAGGTFTSGSHYVVSTSDQTISPGQRFNRLVEISVVGTSSDGFSQVTVSADAVIYPLLARIPPSPLMVGGVAGTTTSFASFGSRLVVGANINGLGQGSPLSVWAKGVVNQPGLGLTTCQPQHISAGTCGANALTQLANIGSDIVDNDPGFPADLWLYTFNLPVTASQSLIQEANMFAADCASVSSASSGFIWIKGNCVVSPGVTLGSANEPVLLIVENGHFALKTSAKVYGLVLLATSAGYGPYQVLMDSGAALYGALLSNTQIDTATTVLRVIYDAVVLNQFQQPPYLRVAMVPGSWRDF